MSVSQIINKITGKIDPLYIAGGGSSTLEDVLANGNSAGPYDIIADNSTIRASELQTEQLALSVGSLQNEINIDNTLKFNTGSELKFENTPIITTLNTDSSGVLVVDNSISSQNLTLSNKLIFSGSDVIIDTIPNSIGPLIANQIAYDTGSKKLYVQPLVPLSSDLSTVLTTGNSAGNQSIIDLGGLNMSPNTTLNYSSPSTAPSNYSINGVYNIDSGTLPYPVLRFSSSKASGTEQKSLTLSMTDGEAIWSSQWEGYIPQNIRTKQSVFTIDGQGVGAQTNIISDSVNITPNFASTSQVNVTGDLSATNVYGNNLIYNVLGSTYINSTGTSTKTISLNTTQPTNVFYVSTNGSDLSGNGTLLQPYSTIQKAVTQAELVSSSSNPCTILVNAGIYNGTVAINKGYITISSIAQNAQATNTVKINNAITINCQGTNDLYGRQVNFYGITFATSVTDNSTVQHTTIFENCYFSSSTRCLYVTNSLGATDCRVYVNNCIFSQTSSSTSPAIEQTYGWLAMNSNYITVDANVNCLLVSGNAYLLRANMIQFESNHSGSSPIVSITSTASTPHSLSNCAFIYQNGTGKVNGTSCGISLTRPNVTSVIILNNFFSLTGTSNPAGHSVETVGSSGSVNVAFGGNFASPLYAYQITTTGTTKIPFQSVT